MSNALGGLFRWLRKRRRIAVNPMDGMREARGLWRERARAEQRCVSQTVGGVRRRAIRQGCQGHERRTRAQDDQVAGMRRSELSDDTGRRPGKCIKIKHAYTVPLAPMVKKILDELDSEFVFTTNGRTPFSGFSKAKVRA